ncbi:hypothetical protein C8R43DRAFT_978703 [Mycena crocata]|nr:hypothetical protein C8R43DRAFT_978703 [Mycena crocata]
MLPSNEAEFMQQVCDLPYSKRHGYATRLALENDPKLPAFIKELLATTSLPSTVPYPSSSEESDVPQFMELQFPQTTASKKFVQRELALAMAIALGRPAFPILAESLLHPSTAGRAKVIEACVKYGSDQELVDVYHHSVPAVQQALRDSFTKADRKDLLTTLGLPVSVPPEAEEPEMSILERSLEDAAEYKRDEIWNKTTLATVWPHHQLRNPKYIAEDSMLNLMEKLFELVETFPPTRSPDSQSSGSYKLPAAVSHRFLSFLRTDLPRSLALVTRFCHVVSTVKGMDSFSLPNSFMGDRYCRRFWHALDLQTQQNHVEPFIANLLEANNGALLKNGQLLKVDLLSQVRWPIVSSITNKAIAFLKGCTVTAQHDERQNVIKLILSGLGTLHHRLVALATVDSDQKREDQAAIENGASELIVHTVKQFISSLTASEKSDQDIVSKLQSVFIGPTINQFQPQYHPLAKVVFENVKGIFSMQHVPSSSLQNIAPGLLRALESKTRTIFHIPDNGIIQPYSNLPLGDNDCVFQLIVNLWSPKDHLPFYTNNVCNLLTRAQKDHIWSTYLNDTDYFLGRLLPSDSYTTFRALEMFPSSPKARSAVVSALIAHPETDDGTMKKLYALADISDPAIRTALQKQTYTRLFDDRLVVYRSMITTTMASGSVQEFIATMKFFVPRIKNEIPPDAQNIPYIFNVQNVVELIRGATKQEATEIAEIYVAWENQCNEAVSPLYGISTHILSVVEHCLAIFCGTPSSVFFQMALQILWIRCLNDHGLSKARLEFVSRSASHSSDYRNTEEHELAFRKFLATVDKDLGKYGFWRIQDEVAYVDELRRQHQTVYENQIFEDTPAYPVFMRAMLESLGTRWYKVPLLRDYVDKQMAVIRSAKGTGDSPSDWDQPLVTDAVAFILQLRNIYNQVMEENPSAWWREFRDLRLLSTKTMTEVYLRRDECKDDKGAQDSKKLDALVELLLRTHNTAIYIPFVSQHLMNNRQDLLRDEYVTTGKRGVFNPRPSDEVEGDRVEPAEWDFLTGSRFSPHQCEVFAAQLLGVIYSKEFPLQQRVTATEKYTKLPSTTIHELAVLLKDDINPRISEAILMFMPRLDEPAAGIQFLLAPSILAGDLARTAVHSVKRSLEHVPLASVPAFLELPASKPLKIGVFKELVRIISTYISLSQMQDMVKDLWDRKLHQDVRIALLQSILPALDSPQQDLAWYIIDKAISSLNTLQADDTPFVLLAVIPEIATSGWDGVLLPYQPASATSPALGDMAQVTIPAKHCERYIETVLWPLTRIRLDAGLVESVKSDKKKFVELADRIPLICFAAYMTSFGAFLAPDNAVQLAERAARDCKEFVDIGPEAHVAQGWLFQYLVASIGRCVAKNQDSWKFLLSVIDLLASRVATFQSEPTVAGRRSIDQLNDLHLAQNFLFDAPDSVRTQVTQDRMQILQPLIDHNVLDFFASEAYQRRFSLLKTHVTRVKNALPEVRLLIAENIKLSYTLQHPFETVVENLRQLLATIPVAKQVAEIRAEILAGDHGVSDAPWCNELMLTTLKTAHSCTASYARELNVFHTHVATQQPAFHQNNWKEFQSLICLVLKASSLKDSLLGSSEAFEILVKPVIQRRQAVEQDIIMEIFNQFPHLFFLHAPGCAQELIHEALVQSRPGDAGSLERATKMVASLISHVSYSRKDAASFSACFIADTLYSGRFMDLALDQLRYSTESTLSFPYLRGSDESGGDIEDRSAKSTVAGVQKLYDAWKQKHAGTFAKKSGDAKSTYSSSAALQVVLTIYKSSTKLIVAHPGLFFSCLCLAFSDPALYSHAAQLFSSLREVLVRQYGSQNLGWVPPAELTLSFAQKMLEELPGEVADAVVGDFDIGVTASKVEAVKLLLWWTKVMLVKDDSLGYEEMVKAEGRERLLGEYERLRLAAVNDSAPLVRITALQDLKKASEL